MLVSRKCQGKNAESHGSSHRKFWKTESKFTKRPVAGWGWGGGKREGGRGDFRKVEILWKIL